MSEGWNELELLDLIEDQLDGPAASALRQKVGSDRALLARIDAMRADRSMLRSLGEPELPAGTMDDIAAATREGSIGNGLMRDLEPMIARPMLMEPPGEFRRRHRRRNRSRAIGWGVAAVVTMALGAGLWIGVTELTRSGPLVADAGRAASPSVGDVSAVAGVGSESGVVPEGWVHHWRPVAGEPAVAARGVNEPSVTKPSAASNAPFDVAAGPRVAGFAVVVQADDAGAAIERLKRTVERMGDRAALVKNFTFAEADAIGLALTRESIRIAAHDSPTLADARGRSDDAGRASGRASGGGPRVGEMLSKSQRGEAVMRDGLLAGSRDAMASYEAQLELSDRGATYTLSVPAGELVSVLRELNLSHGMLTMLEPLDVKTEQPKISQRVSTARGIQIEQMWVDQFGKVREAAAMVADRDGGVVLVPVRVVGK